MQKKNNKLFNIQPEIKGFAKNSYAYVTTKVSFDTLLILTLVGIFIFLEGLSLFDEGDEPGSFNMKTQLSIPILFGGIGGYSYSIIESTLPRHIKNKHRHIRKTFSFAGSIAGVAAVNLLNPSANVSQSLVLSLIAGLSGISYLKRIALVDSKLEDDLMVDINVNKFDTQKNLDILEKLAKEHPQSIPEDKDQIKRISDAKEKLDKLNTTSSD